MKLEELAQTEEFKKKLRRAIIKTKISRILFIILHPIIYYKHKINPN